MTLITLWPASAASSAARPWPVILMLCVAHTTFTLRVVAFGIDEPKPRED